MNYRSLALAIAALSAAHITSADAQSVYVAPGGIYIGGGPVFVTPAPSYGNGNNVEPVYYGNGNGYANGNGYPYGNGYGAPVPLLAGYGVAAPIGLNGNGYGYRNGYGPPRPPAYYNGDPVLSTYAWSRAPRPPAAIPYNGNRRCIAGRGYARCY